MPKPFPQTGLTEVTTEITPSNAIRQARRRTFTRAYKEQILQEASRCETGKDVAALLRREGLYSSHLSQWRTQLRTHGPPGLEPRPVGRKRRDERDLQIARLEREKERLSRELLVARKLIDLAGKAHEILGVALPSLENDETP